MNFRDIWNLVITGDTSDVDKKVKDLGKTAEETGATADTSIRGRMGGALSNVAQKIPGVSGLMDKFGVSSSQAGALMGTAVAGGAAAAGIAVEKFLVASVNEFQTQAQEVLHFKEVTGLAADEASRFVAVADDFGVSGEELSAAIGKLDKAAGAKDKLAALGIEIGRTKDGGYDAQQTFLNVVDAFNATDDASKKAEIGTAAFGKGWQGMVNLLEQGSGKIKASFAGVDDFQMFDDKDLAASEAWRHSMDDLNDAVKGFEKELGGALVPLLSSVADVVTRVAEKAHEHEGGVGLFARALGAIADAAGTVIAPAVGAAQALGLLDDSGKPMEHIVEQAEAIAGAIPSATKAADDLRQSIDLTTGSGSEYAQGNEAYRQSLDAAREALEKATTATDNYRAAQRALMNDQLGLQGSIYSSLDAVDAYRTKVDDATATTREQEQANIAVQQSFDAVAQKAIDTAAQQAVLHGATLTATGSINAQLSALREVAKELGPEDGKVRAELDLYMLALYNIPGQIVTNVDLTGTGVAVLGRSGTGNRREGSGLGSAGNPASGQDTVADIKAYEARNGNGWRS